MAQEVKIRITATDEASAAFRNLGDVARGAFSFALGVGMIEGLGKARDILTDYVRGAMDAESVQADLNAVLASTKGVSGMTADAVNDLAKSLQAVTKFEDDSIVKGEGMLLTFTNIGKDVFPQATEAVLDMATKFKMDLPQAAIILGKALNDPIAGVGALRRIGVMLTDEQKDMIDSFMAVGDVASAQKIILGEVQTELGGVARAAGDTTAGQLAILQNTINGVKDDIGMAFLPLIKDVAGELAAGLRSPEAQAALASLTGFIKNDLIPSFKDAAVWIKENKAGVADLVTQIGILMTTPLGDALKANTELWKNLNGILVPVNDILKSININVGVGTDSLNVWNVALGQIKKTLEVITGGPLAWYKEGLSAILGFYNQLIQSGKDLEKFIFTGGGITLPGFASGGIVPGPLGMPQLAIVHGGETIIPAGATNNYNLTINSNSPIEPIIGDFRMLQSLAGV